MIYEKEVKFAKYSMSEWFLLSDNSANVQLYHGENKLQSMRWCLIFTMPTGLVGIFSDSSLKQ
jgi:hypothetical protein